MSTDTPVPTAAQDPEEARDNLDHPPEDDSVHARPALLWYDKDIGFLWRSLFLGSIVYCVISRVWFRLLGTSPQQESLISSWQWISLGATSFMEILSLVLAILIVARLVRLPRGGHLRLAAVVVFGMIAPSLIYAVGHFFLTRYGLGMDIYHVVGAQAGLVAAAVFSLTIPDIGWRRHVAYLLLLIPSILVLTGEIMSSTQSVSSPGILFRIARDVYLAAPVLWLILVRVPGTTTTALLSLAMAAVTTIVLKVVPGSSGVLSSIIGIPVGVGFSSHLLISIFLWALFYITLSYLRTGRRWGTFVGTAFLMWAVFAYGPYHSRDVWPVLVVSWGLLYAVSFLPAGMEKGLDCEKATSFLKNRYPTLYDHIAITCSSGEVEEIRLEVGECEGLPDWMLVPVSHVPILPYLVSPTPRLLPRDQEMREHVVIWDKGFFSEDILGQDPAHEHEALWFCTVNIWWGSGMTGTIHAPSSLKDVEDAMEELLLVAQGSGVAMERILKQETHDEEGDGDNEG